MVTARAFEGSRCAERRGSWRLGEAETFKDKGHQGFSFQGPGKRCEGGTGMSPVPACELSWGRDQA